MNQPQVNDLVYQFDENGGIPVVVAKITSLDPLSDSVGLRLDNGTTLFIASANLSYFNNLNSKNCWVLDDSVDILRINPSDAVDPMPESVPGVDLRKELIELIAYHELGDDLGMPNEVVANYMLNSVLSLDIALASLRSEAD